MIIPLWSRVMKHYGDITQLSGYELPVVDCIVGGSPCQDLSVAGARAGLEGERSGLFMEQIRIIKEMRENDRNNGRTGYIIRPRFAVWENVPGVLSSGKPKGADFQAVLTEFAKIIEPQAPDVPVPEKGWPYAGCLYDEMGRWSIAWRIHDAQFWGTPQRRKRIALVADFGGLCAPEVLFERKGNTWGNNERIAKKGYAGSVNEGFKTVAYSFYPSAGKTFSLQFETELMGTIRECNRNAVIIRNNDGFELRYATPKEYERLQGFPDSWTDIGEWTDSKGKKHKSSDTARYKALGNSIALPFWFWLMRRISAQYERPATLGSLFDGIGGFPLCWERCNGKGTAIWASEIEEFPIAVTKKHFGEEEA